MIKIMVIVFILLTSSCNNNEIETLKIGTTTSFVNTGVLDYLVEEYKKTNDINIEYVSVGSGKAIELGKTDDVDVLIIHSDDEIEESLVEEGYTKSRISFIENEYVFVSANAYDEIWDNVFVSRGDMSGTHVKELQIWEYTKFQKPEKYIETGQGMLDTLIITNELEGTTLIDKGTWISNKYKTNSLTEYSINNQHARNVYSAHVVISDDEKNMNISDEFVQWLTSNETIDKIENFKKDIYGESLFYKYER